LSNVASIVASAFASATFWALEKPAIRRIQFKSAPAQKLLPWPSRITARTASSASSAFNASVNSAIDVSSNALCTSGRASATSATLSRISTTSVVYDAAFRLLVRFAALGMVGVTSGRRRTSSAGSRD
jgi:hypothetical protein